MQIFGLFEDGYGLAALDPLPRTEKRPRVARYPFLRCVVHSGGLLADRARRNRADV